MRLERLCTTEVSLELAGGATALRPGHTVIESLLHRSGLLSLPSRTTYHTVSA